MGRTEVGEHSPTLEPKTNKVVSRFKEFRRLTFIRSFHRACGVHSHIQDASLNEMPYVDQAFKGKTIRDA